MPTNVKMPQMGESIAEGTVVRWVKKVGDRVEKDEPLFEISTDKVDAEIPSPAAGVLARIAVKEGETVPVDSVVAVIEVAGDDARTRAPEPAAPPVSADATPGAAGPPARPAASEGAIPTAPGSGGGRRQRTSPLVRRIARERGVDLAAIAGSGIGGRVTKKDILEHIETGRAQPAVEAAAETAVLPAVPVVGPGDRVDVVPMSIMRRKIAEHMVLSRRTSAHVHSVFEVDFSHVARIREAKKAEYERAGARLTYLTFIARAAIDALRAVPIVNSSVDGTNIVYRKDIHLGIAVALDWGLIVPVVRHADEKNLLGLARAIGDLADRARAKQLSPDEVQGGTFTITNPGSLGTLLGMPIINQPQVAILGVGVVEKRVVVIDDAIGVRPRAYLTLGYDHRVVDGAVADQFMSHLKRRIEEFDPAAA